MKRAVLLLSIFTICVFSAGVVYRRTSSAQVPLPVLSKPDRHDPELASTIRRLTDRSDKGLARKRLQNGTFKLDLEGRYQDVPIVKYDSEDDLAVGCVTSLGEANHFFGRNLETGQVYAESTTDDPEYLAAKHAARDMSAQEFETYKQMIAGATASASANASTSTTITIVNADGPGEGFNDPTPMSPEGGNPGTTLGELRLNLFNQAAAIWAAYLDTPVPIKINATFDPLTPCTSAGGVLGSAGTAEIFSDFPNAPMANTWYPGALANKLAGTDQDPDKADINAHFNSKVDTGCLGAGRRFYYGFDNATPSQRVNLLVVLLHEMGHGLGFQTFVNGTTGAEQSGVPDVFEKHIFDRTTGLYWSDMTAAQRVSSTLNDGNLLFDGANIDGASGSLTAGRDTSTGRVQLYAPATFEPGSSVSHFDKPASPNLLMEPVINAGLSLDLDLTRQEMRDIGWTRDSDNDGVADSITNVSPTDAGGVDLWVPGESRTVTWTNGGGFARNVSIELSTDGGTTFSVPLATDIPNVGSYRLTVPTGITMAGLGKIRVREAGFTAPAAVSVGDVSIALPVSTSVTVRGRILTPSGQGLRNAVVSVTDGSGVVRTTLSSSLGFYSVDNVKTGSVRIAVSSKRYRFSSRTVTVTGFDPSFDLTGLE